MDTLFKNESQRNIVEKLFKMIKEHYKNNLCSIAIFGSYARQEARLNSDLDLFIVLHNRHLDTRTAMHRDFVVSIENPLQHDLLLLKQQNLDMAISPIIIAKQQASVFNPLYFDMLESIFIVFDDNNFLKKTLVLVKNFMSKHGSEKKYIGGHWYWQANPNLKYGEIVDYEI